MAAPSFAQDIEDTQLADAVERASDQHPWPEREEADADEQFLRSIDRSTANKDQLVLARLRASTLYRYCAMLHARSFLRQNETAETVAKASLDLCEPERARVVEWLAVQGFGMQQASEIADRDRAMFHDQIVSQVIFKRSEMAKE